MSEKYEKVRHSNIEMHQLKNKTKTLFHETKHNKKGYETIKKFKKCIYKWVKKMKKYGIYIEMKPGQKLYYGIRNSKAVKQINRERSIRAKQGKK